MSQERPTQEVERFRPMFMRGSSQRRNMISDPAGDLVTYEDHQRLLQAEEKAATMWAEAAAGLQADLNAAESKISSVVEELGERIGGQRVAEDDRAELVRERARLLVPVYEELLQLLRDKGTEQGGEACDGSGTILCAEPDGSTPEVTHRVGCPGCDNCAPVSIEGDAGLEELLGWVRKQRDKEADLQAEATGPMEDLRGGAVSAFEQVEHHIRARLSTQQQLEQSTTGKKRGGQ